MLGSDLGQVKTRHNQKGANGQCVILWLYVANHIRARKALCKC